MTHTFMPGWNNGVLTGSCVKCGMPKDHANHESDRDKTSADAVRFDKTTGTWQSSA